MYEIQDGRGKVVGRADTFDAAEERLEELCAQAAAQAAANGEGTREMVLEWRIVESATGRVAARMSYSPDDSGRPYEPITQIAPTIGEQE